jgi:hypothetical protein
MEASCGGERVSVGQIVQRVIGGKVVEWMVCTEGTSKRTTQPAEQGCRSTCQTRVQTEGALQLGQLIVLLLALLSETLLQRVHINIAVRRRVYLSHIGIDIGDGRGSGRSVRSIHSSDDGVSERAAQQQRDGRHKEQAKEARAQHDGRKEI